MKARLVLTAFSALVHAYVAWRLIPPILDLPGAWVPLAAVLLSSALLIPLGLLASRRRSGPWVAVAAYLGLLLMGLYSSLFVLTVLRDAMLGVTALFELIRPGFDATALARNSALAVPPLALLITVLGFANARRIARVKTVDVPIRDLPDGLQGFTIAQISDIHVGPTIKKPYLQGIVDAVNRLKADMVAITGDLVDGSVQELSAHVTPLTELASRHGTFFVTGNHDYYSGANAWVAHLRTLDVRVLMNEHAVLRHGGAELVVAGVTDYTAHNFEPTQRSDAHAAMAGAPASAGAKVLLAHQPRSASAAAEAGFHLQLSGHTHGGQFLPWNFFVKLQQPFVAGLHRVQDMWVYTSRGTGYWGPPKRFGAPSEITLLRLIRG